MRDLLRLITEAQATLAQPSPGPADPALARACDGILQSLLQSAQDQQAHAGALQRCVEANPDPVFCLDRDLVCRYANSAAGRALGASAAACLGRPLAALMPPAALGALQGACERALAGDAAETCPLTLATGGADVRWDCRVTAASAGVLVWWRSVGETNAAGGQGPRTEGDLAQDAKDRLAELAWTNLALQAEIRQRQRAEQALGASEGHWRAIFDGAAAGMATVDLRGIVLDANPALAAMAGVAAEEMRGRPWSEALCSSELDGLLPRLANSAAQGGATTRLEVRYARPDGTVRWAAVAVTLLRGEGAREPLVVATVEDVTEEKEARAALVQAQKLNVTGQLAAALTHEVKNPLQSAIGCLGLIDERLERGDEARQYLQVARQELRRADRILNRLRDLNIRHARDDAVPTDLVALLHRVLVLTEMQRLNQHVELQVEVEENLPAVPVVADDMEQVFLNLVLNALEAMPDGGLLAIRLEWTEDPEGVGVAVCDTGIGITDEALPQIYDFLYTTKDHGTGLGLFVSREVIRRHQGRISVASHPGEGTRFDLWLPLNRG